MANLGFCFVAKAWTLGLGLGSMVLFVCDVENFACVCIVKMDEDQ